MAEVLIILAILAVLWYVGVRRRPWKTCRSCGGRGRLAGFIFGTHGDCRACKTTGRRRRVGAPGEGQ